MSIEYAEGWDAAESKCDAEKTLLKAEIAFLKAEAAIYANQLMNISASYVMANNDRLDFKELLEECYMHIAGEHLSLRIKERLKL